MQRVPDVLKLGMTSYTDILTLLLYHTIKLIKK